MEALVWGLSATLAALGGILLALSLVHSELGWLVLRPLLPLFCLALGMSQVLFLVAYCLESLNNFLRLGSLISQEI